MTVLFFVMCSHPDYLCVVRVSTGLWFRKLGILRLSEHQNVPDRQMECNLLILLERILNSPSRVLASNVNLGQAITVIRKCVITSSLEANAIFRNRLNSLSEDFFAKPSAILGGIDFADLVSCDRRSLSDLGSLRAKV